MEYRLIKLIDCCFDFLPAFDKPGQVPERYRESYGYTDFIRKWMDAAVVGHINYEGEKMIGDIPYVFFKGRRGFFHIPFKTLRYIKKQQPEVVLTQGLIFPLQVIALHLTLGKRCRIITQHHGEKPFPGIKRIFQQWADRCTNAYLFTASENAHPWIARRIICDKNKCHEVLEASTYFKPMEKEMSRQRLGMPGTDNFLWVGRLHANKDPLTVLHGFEKYLTQNAAAKLYMIYQGEDLIREVNAFISRSHLLREAVFLKGEVPHEALPCWYSAADFYISGSHEEGSGYALLEAMACGCIPVVTDIPSFRKITGEGKYGLLYPPGNAGALCMLLCSLEDVDKDKLSLAVRNYFSEALSFESIARQVFSICHELTAETLPEHGMRNKAKA